MRRPRQLAFVVALAGAAAACNMVAGIADYREVAAFEPASSGGGNPDGASPTNDADPSGDANGSDAGNAADSLLAPGCFTIAVVASPSGAYTGVQVTAPSPLVQPIPAGENRTICGAAGDVVELHGQPDRSNALHRWDGTPCPTDGRCRFTVTGTIHVTVYLE